MAEVKKTSLNLDPSVVADAKIAIVEAEHLGLAAPRNLSALVNEALASTTRSLREEIERAKSNRDAKGKAPEGRPARGAVDGGKGDAKTPAGGRAR